MADDLRKDIDRNIRRNLGTFGVPRFNHVGDPHDKQTTRPNLTTRAGIQLNQQASFWKQAIHHELNAATRAAPAAQPPPYVVGMAAANTIVPQAQSTEGSALPAQPPPQSPPLSGILPPGWYMVPTYHPHTQPYGGGPAAGTHTLAYVPFHFQKPPEMVG